MAIREKIQKVKEMPVDEKKRQEVIDKSYLENELVIDQNSKEKVIFTIRIKKEMLRNIDEALIHREGISKTGWILESIHEKLKRDEKHD